MSQVLRTSPAKYCTWSIILMIIIIIIIIIIMTIVIMIVYYEFCANAV